MHVSSTLNVPGASLEILSRFADAIERAIDAADATHDAIRRALIDLVNVVDQLWSAIAADDREYDAWIGDDQDDESDDEGDGWGPMVPVAA